MVCNWIQMKGVTLFDEQIQPREISHYVIQQNLAEFNKRIQEYKKDRDQVAGPWKGIGGPSPHNSIGSCIHDYLWGYSIRSGCLGKLAGLIYRIIEFTRELLCCCCNSHRRRALEEIADLLQDVNNLNNPNAYPVGSDALVPAIVNRPNGDPGIRALILEKMLDDYNVQVNSVLQTNRMRQAV